MRMIDLIIKKRDGGSLTKEELTFIIKGYTENIIPDYQMSALLMAIKFVGMNKQETIDLTQLMMHSGDTIDLSSIKGIKVDKHSTGGVGDKTSLALGPMVAACGAKVAKMSGRGLGHTGGTLDKMEAIPNLSVSLSPQQFIDQVNKIGLAIIGQTARVVPADKKLYALRDVTGTIESLPLIAGSVMSKKLASGADTILLDVKFGKGAFMKTLNDARKLARVMVDIGNGLKRDTRAILTDMDQPLGLAIGNSLEVIEAIDTLNGKGPDDFVELCLKAGSIMLKQANLVTDLLQGEQLLIEVINSKAALSKFKQMVKMQGGDTEYIDDPGRFKKAKNIKPVISKEQGYVKTINALLIGETAMRLGAGRATKDEEIDLSAGIVLIKKVGDKVNRGDILGHIHTNIDNFKEEMNDVNKAYQIVNEKVKRPKIVHEIIQ
jgi:pyrimidine-nucleoside phosphorylase